MSPIVTPFTGQADEWDGFVRSQPGWTHFHLFGWKPLMVEVFGHDCPYLVARETDGTISGVLPLVRVRSALFGHYLVSMPYLNYGGPLGSTEAVRALATAVEAMARSGSVKLAELRSRQPLAIDLPVSHRKITVVLDLPAETAALSKALGSKLRSQIKRPEKEGVTVAFGPDQVEPFFAVFAHHMRDLGTPTQPLALFAAIQRTFPDDVWFGCAYYQGKPIAAGAGFRWNSEFEMTWASALSEYNKLSPNMLLYWAFMQRAVDAGLGLFNFGRCSIGGGTHRFKSQWGSRDEQLWWYQVADTPEAATPSPDAGAYSWGPRIWKRLPLAVATTIGPHLVRGIP
ncbi:MAG: FemAB family XrtA/PEP-CTERM system-associated protein [Gemmatimonadota bacterium]